jgi:hypothetical protein
MPFLRLINTSKIENRRLRALTDRHHIPIKLAILVQPSGSRHGLRNFLPNHRRCLDPRIPLVASCKHHHVCIQYVSTLKLQTILYKSLDGISRFDFDLPTNNPC